MNRLIFVLFLLLTGVTKVSAMTDDPGILMGQVIDRETKEPVAYAYLHIEELNRTAVADANGNYEIKNVPAGNFH